ncbi:MAG: helix-turn-helix domain-containing protein [Nocardioides sp.]
MPRKTAEERHTVDAGAPSELMDVLIALHHPTRRWLAELLWVEGPATVGRLAARTGLAVGSVSHHLKPLHQQGFIAPAPELARDTRESWWKTTPRSLSWSVEDFEPDTLGRRVADQAELENFRYQVRSVQQWLKEMADAPAYWRRAAGSSDSLVKATADQTADLHRRLDAVLAEWTNQVRADERTHPDADRRPVRALVRCFPSHPVRP